MTRGLRFRVGIGCMGHWLLAMAAALAPVSPTARAAQVDIPGPLGSSGAFGARVIVLPNGNIVVPDPQWNGGTGAVHLYDPDGVPISSLSGSLVTHRVGSDVVVLASGNFVVCSPLWDNGTLANVGAVTWVDGDTGLADVVSAANSLIGARSDDRVGTTATALVNGNYVVASPLWDSAAAQNVGAVTWADGNSGLTSTVSESNSLVGASLGDAIGSSGVAALANGHYLVRSPEWRNGPNANDAGAVTWASGTTGLVGIVSTSNSLVGSTADDFVGNTGVSSLVNGDYVVVSSDWNNGGAVRSGAVTWVDGATGLAATVSAANSLVGTTTDDRVGSDGIAVLGNGNYVIVSTGWNNGANVQAGAVTWANGNGGRSGEVSAANSLVGTGAGNQIGNGGIVELANGNFVVRSQFWSSGAILGAGAVTWASGDSGIAGMVSPANSLVGSTANDIVGLGGVTPLANGNYVVTSVQWHNGGVVDSGAVTWADGDTGLTGPVLPANSLIGTVAFDRVGGGGVAALSDGHYVVGSPIWNDGAFANVGAATWADGNTGLVGLVTPANSLIGTTSDDGVGTSIAALGNGRFVVGSLGWDNGATVNVGAVTWVDGGAGTSGVVSAANSLVGATADDSIGSDGIVALVGGHYVVRSSGWSAGGSAFVGAVTWANGNIGLVGTVSSANSLVGTAFDDLIGLGDLVALANGNYVVNSPFWDSGAIVEAGAITLARGDAGSSGPVGPANSVVGSVANSGLSAVFVHDDARARLLVGRRASRIVSILTLPGDLILSDGFE